MDIDKLVHMANSIGQFFAAYPDRDEAVVSIARRIEMYWTPQMRRELLAGVTLAAGHHGLLPLVAEAISKHLVHPDPALKA